MRTERARAAGEAGFTLVEVLAAMIILAVGLLGLEALGIGAARSLTRAERQGELTVLATRVMEGRLQEVRRNPAVVDAGERCGVDAPSSLYVCSQVESGGAAGLAAHTVRVTVTARRTPESTDALTIRSHAYHPDFP